MHATLPLTLALLLAFSGCSGGSEGDNGGTPTITIDSPCLIGKTWTLRTVSTSTIQQSGFWLFRSDGRYDWQRTAPLQDGGTGNYSYSGGVLTVDGYLKNKLVRSGQISLSFDRNRMSFRDDNGAVWIYDPPSSCALMLIPDALIATGTWQFDLLPDDGSAAEQFGRGELFQQRDLVGGDLVGGDLVGGDLVRVESADGAPLMQGLLDADGHWRVQVTAGFEFRGQFLGQVPGINNTRFRGTYQRREHSGEILGYRVDARSTDR